MTWCRSGGCAELYPSLAFMQAVPAMRKLGDAQKFWQLEYLDHSSALTNLERILILCAATVDCIRTHNWLLEHPSASLVQWADPLRPPSHCRVKFDFVAKIRYERNDRARNICVDQKTHDGLSSGQRVKRLLLGKLADESQRRPNIVSSKIVFALNFLKGHAAGEASDHDRYRHTAAPNHGFPVANIRIENNVVLSLHGLLDGIGFSRLSRFQLHSGEYRERSLRRSRQFKLRA